MTATINDSTPATQAARVIAKFGSACKLAKLLEMDNASVYRWTYARSNGGTDGIIPGKSLRRVLELAKRMGVTITATDLYPSA